MKIRRTRKEKFTFWQRYRFFQNIGMTNAAEEMRKGAFRYGWASRYYWTFELIGVGTVESSGLMNLLLKEVTIFD